MTAKLLPFAPPDEESRLTKLLGRKAAMQVAMRQLEEEIAIVCRRYSADNGFRVNLNVEQVVRDMKHGRRM